MNRIPGVHRAMDGTPRGERGEPPRGGSPTRGPPGRGDRMFDSFGGWNHWPQRVPGNGQREGYIEGGRVGGPGSFWLLVVMASNLIAMASVMLI